MGSTRPGSGSGPLPGMHPSGYGGPGYGGYMQDRHEDAPTMGHKDRKEHYKEGSSMDIDDPRMMDSRPPPHPSHGGGGPMPPMGHHSHPSHGGSMDYGRMMPGGPAPPPHYSHRRGGSHGGGSQGDLRGAMIGEPPGGPGGPPAPYGEGPGGGASGANAGWDRVRMERERDRERERERERERHHGYRGPNVP